MTTQEIVTKLWNLCDVLRDDGITYHQYVTELTYILFLKMAKETGAEAAIPETCRWDALAAKSGVELEHVYKQVLAELSENGTGRAQEVYQGTVSSIDEPKNLEKIISSIDALGWYSAQEEDLSNLYEGLLEKSTNEEKSGVGQCFTPRVLIDVMVRLMKPQVGELYNDPAYDTFGSTIAADRYLKDQTDDYFDLDEDQAAFQKRRAFTGYELVHGTHHPALMSAMLHSIEGEILPADTLSTAGKAMRGHDLVLTNPPFGTKKDGGRATRDDFAFATSNKQLNFLQHVYRNLKRGDRATVVLPNNVLFADDGDDRTRVDLIDKCTLHTVLCLPAGISYAQGIRANVLSFARGQNDRGSTKEVWFYGLHINMPSFGKTTPLRKEHFADFGAAFETEDRRVVRDERWSAFSREEVRTKRDSLGLDLIRDESLLDYDDLPNPIESGETCIAQLGEAMGLLKGVVRELQGPTGRKAN